MAFLQDLGMAAATNVVGSNLNTANNAFQSFLFGGKEGFTSWRNAFTQQGLTGQQQELQRLHDTQYQRTVADLTAAGINPAMLFGSTSPNGVVSPSSSPQQATNAELLTGINQIQNNRMQKAQTAMIWADAKGKMINNLTLNAKNIAELQVMLAEAKKKGVETDSLQRNLDLLNASFESQVESYEYAAQQAGENVKKTREETENIKEQRKVIVEEARLKAAQADVEELKKQYTREQINIAKEQVIALKADNHFISEMKNAGIPPQILNSDIGVVLVTALGVDGMKALVEDVRGFIQKLSEDKVPVNGDRKGLTEFIRDLFPGANEDEVFAAGGFGGKSSVSSGSNTAKGGGSR